MAEFHNPSFDPEKVVEIDDNDDTIIVDDPDLSTGRTTTDPSGPSTHVSLQQELLQTAVDEYYNVIAEKGYTPVLGHDSTKFELVEGRLRLKANPNERIINIKTRKPLSLATIKGLPGGRIILDELGFE